MSDDSNIQVEECGECGWVDCACGCGDDNRKILSLMPITDPDEVTALLQDCDEVLGAEMTGVEDNVTVAYDGNLCFVIEHEDRTVSMAISPETFNKMFLAAGDLMKTAKEISDAETQ